MYKESQVKKYIEQRDLITETNKLNQEHPFQEAKRKEPFFAIYRVGFVFEDQNQHPIVRDNP